MGTGTRDSHRWTSAEDAVLRALYLRKTRAELASMLHLRETQVRARCWTLGLNEKQGADWSAEDIALLRSAYMQPTIEKVSAHLRDSGLRSRRTADAVQIKAARLGLSDPGKPKTGRRKLTRTTETAEDLLALQIRQRKEWIAKYGHPRGALGMKHSPEARQKIALASRRSWADPSSGLNSSANRQRMSDALIARVADGTMRSGYTRSAGGRRADLGDRYFRSSWEANYARFLNQQVRRGLIQGWEYEPETFVFEAIKRGTRAYTPDFKVTFGCGRHEWHEVKGWMDPKSATRLRRMAKYYPDKVVVVIGAAWFKQANRGGLAATILGWEKGGRS